MRLLPALGLLLFAISPVPAQQRDSLPPIDTDRPDLTDGTGTIAPGHLQMESGFTSQTSRDRLHSWSMPELLVRVGVLPRAELRIGQTYRSIETGPRQRVSGLDDLQVGTKLRVATLGALADFSVEGFTTVTTGADGISAGRMLPGGALLLQSHPLGPWSAGTEFELARGASSALSGFNSLSIQYQVSGRLQGYGEWYVMRPGDPGVAQHYLDTGILYLLSNDVQIDGRIGVGVNHAADQSFLGFGLAVRR